MFITKKAVATDCRISFLQCKTGAAVDPGGTVLSTAIYWATTMVSEHVPLFSATPTQQNLFHLTNLCFFVDK
jgi:hypothetical protein